MDVSEPLPPKLLPSELLPSELLSSELLSSEGRFFAEAFYCPGTPPHNIGP